MAHFENKRNDERLAIQALLNSFYATGFSLHLIKTFKKFSLPDIFKRYRQNSRMKWFKSTTKLF